MATAKQKRTVLNAIMVVLAVIVVAAGIAFVVSVRGGSEQSSPFVVSNKVGYANIERAGINYALEEGTTLQEGDTVETLDGSEITVQATGGSSLYLADASKMQVSANDKAQSGVGLKLMSGCVFADATNAAEPVAFESSGNTWTVGDATVVSDARPGTVTVQVLRGDVTLSNGVVVQAGETYTAFTDKAAEGAASGAASDAAASSQAAASTATAGHATNLAITAMDSFALEHALDAIKAGRELVFSESQINGELERRENERLQLANQAAEESGKSNSSQASSGASAQSGSAGSASAGADGKSADAQDSASSAAADNASAGTEEEQEVVNDGQEAEAEDAASTSDADGQDDAVADSEADEVKADATYTCTLQIRCDTILNNMDKLAEGKSKYVPKNGVLLQSTSMTFEEGETAFDVLNRACKDQGIALEYSYVPVYGSYYVEGIGNLYEFDCGDESGWMYKVNGWFPNYGCSQYKLSDGDAIVFCYTCNGLGEDVGA